MEGRSNEFSFQGDETPKQVLNEINKKVFAAGEIQFQTPLDAGSEIAQALRDLNPNDPPGSSPNNPIQLVRIDREPPKRKSPQKPKPKDQHPQKGTIHKFNVLDQVIELAIPETVGLFSYPSFVQCHLLKQGYPRFALFLFGNSTHLRLSSCKTPIFQKIGNSQFPSTSLKTPIFALLSQLQPAWLML